MDMWRRILFVICIFLLTKAVFGQLPEGKETDATIKWIDFPSSIFKKVQDKAERIDIQLTEQTDSYLKQMQRREEKIHSRLLKELKRERDIRQKNGSLLSKDIIALSADSVAIEKLFNEQTKAKYGSITGKMRATSISSYSSCGGEYRPYFDSLMSSFKFLQQHPDLLKARGLENLQSDFAKKTQLNQLQQSLNRIKQLESKMQYADQVKQFMKERKDEISKYISGNTRFVKNVGKELTELNSFLNNYSKQVKEYKAMLNDNDALTRKALSLLNQVPAFQDFIKQNSQLASLFSLPRNYGSSQILSGLQTRDRVSQTIQSQMSAEGTGSTAALKESISNAKAQLDGLKDKLNNLANGDSSVDMPEFKVADQKTKTFWKRLEYGVNFQATKSNQLYPTIVDLGGSIGYKFDHSSVVGIGSSFKAGLGSGWNHIALSGQGIGLRSFIDIKFKGSILVSGGIEYNYRTPVYAVSQVPNFHEWTKSGLIGISKIVSAKNRIFKKTKISLLWDFLSYQQIPRTQPILFRMGYNF